MNVEERMQQVLGEDAQQYTALCNHDTYEEEHFAENSQFYEEVMADGEIFNPYIHRRWLPGQYAHIVRCVDIGCPKYNTMKEYFKWKYDAKYCVKYAESEVYKLYLLRNYSRKAYAERSQFFTIEVLREILKIWVDDVVKQVSDEIKRLERVGGDVSITSYIRIYNGCAVVFSTREQINTIKNGRIVKEVKHSYDGFLNNLKSISHQLETVNNIFDLKRIVDKLSCDTPYPLKDSFQVPDSFYEAFWKSGAYYSIKSKIMTSDNTNAGNDLKDLRKRLEAGTSAREFHGIYLKMLEEEE